MLPKIDPSPLCHAIVIKSHELGQSVETRAPKLIIMLVPKYYLHDEPWWLSGQIPHVSIQVARFESRSGLQY